MAGVVSAGKGPAVSALREGWTFGEIIATKSDPQYGKWLTVLGSAYRAPALYATESEARAAFAARPSCLLGSPHAPVLALVQEVPHAGVTGPRGVAYRIVSGPIAC